MAPFATSEITVISDLAYRDGDRDALLDLYVPKSAPIDGVRLPALIWTHGGAWVSGQKDDADHYFNVIAAQGYAVISLSYSLAPVHQYPTPVIQVNEALAFIQAHAESLFVDSDRIMLAGDSAGAQITSQCAALITNPEYASEVGITPSITPEHVRGVILFCGVYDFPAFIEMAEVVPGFADGMRYWGQQAALRAYAGTVDPGSATLMQMSTINHVTAEFPPAFISGGNGDPLTNHQSIPLAERLRSLGVTVEPIFFDERHEPRLPHEYQFEVELQEARIAVLRMLGFMKQRMT